MPVPSRNPKTNAAAIPPMITASARFEWECAGSPSDQAQIPETTVRRISEHVNNRFLRLDFIVLFSQNHFEGGLISGESLLLGSRGSSVLYGSKY